MEYISAPFKKQIYRNSFMMLLMSFIHNLIASFFQLSFLVKICRLLSITSSIVVIFFSYVTLSVNCILTFFEIIHIIKNHKNTLLVPMK